MNVGNRNRKPCGMHVHVNPYRLFREMHMAMGIGCGMPYVNKRWFYVVNVQWFKLPMFDYFANHSRHNVDGREYEAHVVHSNLHGDQPLAPTQSRRQSVPHMDAGPKDAVHTSQLIVHMNKSTPYHAQ